VKLATTVVDSVFVADLEAEAETVTVTDSLSELGRELESELLIEPTSLKERDDE
jgi:predicted signal transduction protein with EAL and GGDEF domain